MAAAHWEKRHRSARGMIRNGIDLFLSQGIRTFSRKRVKRIPEL